MHPVLFYIGNTPVHSYYLLWTVALSVALFWTRNRAERFYDVDPDKLHNILKWSFIAMLLGARFGGYFDNWTYYYAHPERIWRIWEGGMSSVPAAIFCGLTGIWLCHKERVPVWRLAEAASLPTAACLFIGRWGCYLNGCCYGLKTDCRWGVHFPQLSDGIMVHPTQLYYSVGGLVMLFVLYMFEKYIGRGDRLVKKAFLWPLFMFMYGTERFIVDFLRGGDRIAGLKVGQGLGVIVAISGIVWLINSLKKNS